MASTRLLGFMREFITTIKVDTGHLGSFIRTFYLPATSAGVTTDPRLPDARTPFPCRAPHKLADVSSIKSRRGRSRNANVLTRLTFENIYAGCMTWLSLGSPVHVQSAGRRDETQGVRRTTRSALQLFVEEWEYVCRSVDKVQYTGGRALIKEQLLTSVPGGHAYGMDIMTREWWIDQIPNVTSWDTAAWAVPSEVDGRGAFTKFKGDKISLPSTSAHLPAADLVRQLRPDLAAALERPRDNIADPATRGKFPKVSHVASRAEALVYFKRKYDAGMLQVRKLCDIPHGPDGKPISSSLVSVSKGADSDLNRGISDRRLANWMDKDVDCPKV